MDWVVGITSIVCMELTVRKLWYAWLLSLFNQFLWLIYILTAAQYGLLPLNIALWIMALRGLKRWRREHVRSRLLDAA